ncbi:MaoC/PaaZ C-terminal domain-containing protein [Aquisalimonas asiatica]|uniref:MaoC like domain-containing protein n=1 Tax=Aquisalimonas asiatica TaxID=406100 RepID=A0A1H8TZW3_9GAMM|nr:MaoC/PaaZ C-terminal domain-containing protein [Aquisalimonas asiatica]SEO96552.1 MaoC like domain-containing protein [Aquisalimonas asiatica]
MGGSSHTRHYSRMPSAFRGLVRAALRGGATAETAGDVPPIVACVPPAPPDARRLNAYRAVCGFADDGLLPVTYPHAMAGPLHLAALTHPAFPFRLPGLVHVRNTVCQYRGIDAGEPLALQVALGGRREVDKGVEFDMTTSALDAAGAVVWTGTSTNLARRAGRRPGGARSVPAMGGYAEIGAWEAPAGIGRRYGWIAGDLNPIHLHDALARVFGMPGSIAHGMWLFARSLAALQPSWPGAVRLEVAFRRPVRLPGQVRQWVRDDDGGTTYVLTDPGAEVRHLSGSVAAVP